MSPAIAQFQRLRTAGFGGLPMTVTELLDLPAPGERSAPSLAYRRPSELWTPHRR
ncbi:MAG: hypothetical protein ACT4NY_05375 [Pseudonocardiales bacterium]